MELVVAVTMKDPSEAKTRLGEVLGQDARAEIAIVLFENTLRYFRQCHPSVRLGVVSKSERIRQIAEKHGGDFILEHTKTGLNGAAVCATEWAMSQNADALLLVHADVPLLIDAEFRRILEAGKTNQVVIAESRDGGTNALLLAPPNCIPFHYGPRSADAHALAAGERGITAARLQLQSLANDVDTPADLERMPRLPSQAMSVLVVPGLPEVRAGDDIALLIVDALSNADIEVRENDIFVIAQKIVSKSEGRMRAIASYSPSQEAIEIASRIGKDPRKVEAILSESTEVIRAAALGPDGLLITRHRQGWICANAGIDESNLGNGAVGMLLLLPEDADASASAIRDALFRTFRRKVGVVITDTFGRPWRQGLVNVAIGLAGIPAIIDWTSRTDAYGRGLKATLPAFADEVAGVSGLMMEKDARTPVAIVRGLEWPEAAGSSARDILRPANQDLFL